MKVNNYDAKTGEELSQVKLSADQSARLIRVLKEVVAMRTVEEFEKATNKCQKPMSDYSRIIVETDEKSPKTLAVITADDCETIEGLRVRFLPVYN